MSTILEVSHMRKSFPLSRKQQKLEKSTKPIKVAVDDLSFTVEKGEIFGLLGSNGAGKTTTLRTIATLLQPDAGDVRVDGFSVREAPAEVRRRVGFLTGELRLEDAFTPNYLFDFFADLHGLDPARAAARKQELFTLFGIDRFAEVKVADLSTGMKQKVSIVISTIHDPNIVIFDEPTNGLDILTARIVRDYILDLRTQGKTVILSTHIFDLAEKLCDRVGMIMAGRMIRCGTLKEVQGGLSLEDRFFKLYDQTIEREV